MAETRNILVILGATASGKSELALAAARALGADILSVDSMQVYRGMDIGTAKPSAQEQREIRHHLIDVVNPDQEFTVARFVEMADQILQSRGAPIVVTGGTPLYYKALFEGLFEGPSVDAELRQRLRQMDNEKLHTRLREVDPEAAQRIHINDAKRLIRAIEVFELTGKPISQHQTEWASGQQRYRARWIGLHWEKELLHQRINARVKQMMAAGWVDEVRHLLQQYSHLSKTAGEATGYRELIQHLRGEISLTNAIEEIKIATRQLARRQLKWFRRFPNVQWINGNEPLEKRLEMALSRFVEIPPE